MIYQIIAFITTVLAVISLTHSRKAQAGFEAKQKALDEKTKNGFYPQVEIDNMIEEFIENFKDENIDSIMYMQMAEGITSGAVEIVGNDEIVMISPEYLEKLENDSKLLDSLSTRKSVVKKEIEA